MKPEEYRKDPCGASSLPFWKTNTVEIPPSVVIERDDVFSGVREPDSDEPYFKIIHRLSGLSPQTPPPGFSFVSADAVRFAGHIQSCYEDESVTAEELLRHTEDPVYHPELWIAIRDDASGRIVASGIADLDDTIREGILEWIQVSPEFRRRGFGKLVVNELLYRMRGKADFATVSGRLNSESDPFSLYRSCDFCDPVVWHVVRKRPRCESFCSKE